MFFETRPNFESRLVQCLINASEIGHLGPISIVRENALEYPSFTIEFPEHLASAKRQYCLDQLKNTGALVEPQSELVFMVVCLRPQQLAHVGWALFHTHFKKQCRVISTSAGAEARAGAYPKPPPHGA
jgi:hypothetical protein